MNNFNMNNRFDNQDQFLEDDLYYMEQDQRRLLQQRQQQMMQQQQGFPQQQQGFSNQQQYSNQQERFLKQQQMQQQQQQQQQMLQQQQLIQQQQQLMQERQQVMQQQSLFSNSNHSTPLMSSLSGVPNTIPSSSNTGSMNSQQFFNNSNNNMISPESLYSSGGIDIGAASSFNTRHPMDNGNNMDAFHHQRYPSTHSSNSGVLHVPSSSSTPIVSSTENPGDIWVPPDYKPTDIDICSGRGKAFWNHAGNVAFRNLIQSQVETYINSGSKAEKSAIVVAIVEDLRRQGSKFLKQKKTASGDAVWYDCGDAQARDKVGHSLRDQVTAINRSQRGRSPTPSSASRSPKNSISPKPAGGRRVSPVPSNSGGNNVSNVPKDVNIKAFDDDDDDDDEDDISVGDDEEAVRRPSISLSDSGNEAENRRQALTTSQLFTEFGRRPSWVADSLNEMHSMNSSQRSLPERQDTSQCRAILLADMNDHNDYNNNNNNGSNDANNNNNDSNESDEEQNLFDDGNQKHVSTGPDGEAVVARNPGVRQRRDGRSRFRNQSPNRASLRGSHMSTDTSSDLLTGSIKTIDMNPGSVSRMRMSGMSSLRMSSNASIRMSDVSLLSAGIEHMDLGGSWNDLVGHSSLLDLDEKDEDDEDVERKKRDSKLFEI